MSTMFECFSKIQSSNGESERNSSILSLVRHLAKDNEEDENKEFGYALKRIIRGLGSTNHDNKQTYYTILTTHLSTYENVKVENILSLMEQELHPNKNNAKSEIADVYFGRILTCGALMRSNALQKCNAETKKKVLEELLFSSKQRSYLTHCAICLLVSYCNNIESEEFQNHVWPVLEKEVFKPWKEHTLDSFYLLLVLKQKFPEIITGHDLKSNFGNKKIITKDTIGEVFRILIEIPRIINYKHPIYKLIVEIIIERDLAINLWTLLDKKFQKPSKTDEYVALQLLQYFCDSKVSLIPHLLSTNFTRHAVRICSLNKNMKKNEVANLIKERLVKMISLVIEQVKENDVKESDDEKYILLMDTVKKLLFYPGDLMIEKKTGIKFLHTVFVNLNEGNVKELADIFKNIAINKTQKEVHDSSPVPYMNTERIFAAQNFAKLLTHPKIITAKEWRLENLEFLFNLGFCEQHKTGNVLADQFKECFFRALDDKLSSLSILKSILFDLSTYINDKIFVKETLTLRTPLNEDARAAWHKMFKLAKKIEKSGKDQSISVTFSTIIIHMGLQLFAEPDMAIVSINDVHECYTKVTQKTKNDKEDEPEWIQVVIDLFLSLLSRKNQLLRTIINCVFPHICTHLTRDSMHQILSVLDVRNDKKTLSSVNEIKEDEDADEEMPDSESESENEEEGVENGVEEETDSEIEDMEMDDDDDDGVNEKLRMAVRQALGDAAYETDNEDVDVDLVDEEEGKRLDQSLASAFKMLKDIRKSDTKKQKKSAEMLMHFRTRVIDLLEIYLLPRKSVYTEHSPSMALTLDMIVPLYLLLENCIKDQHQKPLENRVKSCLNKLSSIKQFSKADGIDETVVFSILKTLMEKGERSAAICIEMGDNLAQSCTFLVRCLQQNECSSERVVSFFCDKLTSCFTKSILPLALFKNILKKLCWEGNWKMIPLIQKAAFDPNVRPFMRTHALELLECFYQNDRIISLADEKSKSVLKEMEKELFDNVLETFKHYVKEKNLKQKFLVHTFLLLKAVHSRHAKESWDLDWDKIAEALEDVRTNIQLKGDAKGAFRKLAAVVKPPITTATKRPVENGVDHPTEEPEMKTKKKKKNIQDMDKVCHN